MARQFRVLVATDGSAPAKAALATTVQFPWPTHTRVRAVIARRTREKHRRSILLAALDRSADLAAAGAQRVLSQRWPDGGVVVVDKMPVDGVLGEAERLGADVIVLGWRGHGAVRRLLMGSVSRGVVRRARCAVLVVRHRPQGVRRIVIGIDGSATAQRVVTLVARLTPPRGGRVTLVSAVEPIAPPSQALAPGAMRATVGREVRRMNAARATTAIKKLNRAAAELKRSGWQTRTVFTSGEPLRDLLATVGTERAHLLIVGAKGVSGVRHLFLGSVADGVLNRCPVPVLVVR